METSKTKEQKQIAWIDLVRLFAIMGVVLCHAVDTFMATPEAQGSAEHTLWIELYKTLSRPSVPLFVIITGFLLLPIKTDSIEFYKKRLTRILYPFLFWSVVYSILPWVFYSFTGNNDLIRIFFPYYTEEAPTVIDAALQVVQIPFNFNNTTYPLWYVYMLIGLYLFMPVLSVWLERSSDKEKKIFLGMWCISLFVPYIRAFVTPYIFGEAAWNEFGMFYYFAGFGGYLLVGYWMKVSQHYPLQKKYAITIPLFLAAYWATYEGYHYMMSDPNVTEEGMELFFLFCTPNVMLMTILIFILCSETNIPSRRLRLCLGTLSRCGFGIYMVHYLFVGPMNSLTHWLQVPIALHIPVSTILVFTAAWITTYGLSRLPRHKWIVG